MAISSVGWLVVPGIAWAVLTAVAPPRVVVSAILGAFTFSLFLLVLLPERRMRRLMATMELQAPPPGERERAYAAAYAAARESHEDEETVRAVLARAADALALSEAEARRIEHEVEARGGPK